MSSVYIVSWACGMAIAPLLVLPSKKCTYYLLVFPPWIFASK